MPRNLIFTAGLVGVVAAIVAGATIWLTLTAPATVADAVNNRDMGPMIQAVLSVIYDALVALVRYL